MKSRFPLSLSLSVAALVVSVAVIAALSFPAIAAPPAQGDLNTPTPFPLDGIEYTLETVGGVDETLTFDLAGIDGFTLGETTVTSQYPRGMVFTIAPESPNGEITDVILFFRFNAGTATRFAAEWDPDAGVWVAHAWPTGDGTPAWATFDFYWRVRDETDASVDSESTPMVYWDPNREWYKLDTEVYTVYWWGTADNDPDGFAEYTAWAILATQGRRIAGFGANISYKPVATVYGTREAWDEIYGGGASNPNAAGQTSFGTGQTVQYVRPGLNPQEQAFRLGGVLTHELTHQFQYDIVGGANGPLWWYEGQADWFSIDPGLYDQRLVSLGQMQDMPSLTTPIGANMVQADGRRALAYSVGASFVNWLVQTYGIETHREIVELQAQGIPFYEGIERATGDSFFEIENAWRAYLGLEPFSLADIDPAAALQPYDDPMVAVGERLMLPAMPPLVPVMEAPRERALAAGQCFGSMEIEILAMGQADDGTVYFQVDCMGQIGWMTRDMVVGPQ